VPVVPVIVNPIAILVYLMYLTPIAIFAVG